MFFLMKYTQITPSPPNFDHCGSSAKLRSSDNAYFETHTLPYTRYKPLITQILSIIYLINESLRRNTQKLHPALQTLISVAHQLNLGHQTMCTLSLIQGVFPR